MRASSIARGSARRPARAAWRQPLRVPPGEALFPYHAHANEELIVLEGALAAYPGASAT